MVIVAVAASVLPSVLGAIGAIAAAAVAALAASRARSAQASAERTLELERRLASSKAEVYEPMVESIRGVFDSSATGVDIDEKVLIATLSKFAAWAQIYGSDGVVTATHKWMQAVFNDAPSEVSIYFMTALLIEFRRDIGDPETKLSKVDLLGIKINDIYTSGQAQRLLLPEAEFLALYDWTAPWAS